MPIQPPSGRRGHRHIRPVTISGSRMVGKKRLQSIGGRIVSCVLLYNVKNLEDA
jgi:hypothetical protein